MQYFFESVFSFLYSAKKKKKRKKKKKKIIIILGIYRVIIFYTIRLKTFR